MESKFHVGLIFLLMPDTDLSQASLSLIFPYPYITWHTRQKTLTRFVRFASFLLYLSGIRFISLFLCYTTNIKHVEQRTL